MKRCRTMKLREVTYFAISAFLLVGAVCNPTEPDYAQGTLTISFSFDQGADKYLPTYASAIWLEDDAGKVTTLTLIDEWMATTGYDGYCPAWSTKTKWTPPADDAVDAITTATPFPVKGTHTLPFDCKELKIEKGTYSFCMQTHIWKLDEQEEVDHYILRCGEISLGDQAQQSEATSVSYDPAQKQGFLTVMDNLKATYSIE